MANIFAQIEQQRQASRDLSARGGLSIEDYNARLQDQDEARAKLADELTKAIDDLRKQIETSESEAKSRTETLTKAVTDLSDIIAVADGPNSAGGVIDPNIRTTQFRRRRGNIAATGDLKLSTNYTDLCWLKCDGRDVAIADYPELYSVIGTKFGAAADATKFFKLPSAANLPAIPSGGIDWHIRT